MDATPGFQALSDRWSRGDRGGLMSGSRFHQIISHFHLHFQGQTFRNLLYFHYIIHLDRWAWFCQMFLQLCDCITGATRCIYRTERSFNLIIQPNTGRGSKIIVLNVLFLKFVLLFVVSSGAISTKLVYNQTFKFVIYAIDEIKFYIDRIRYSQII